MQKRSKIGETGRFLLSGTVLSCRTPPCASYTRVYQLYTDVKDGNMGVFTELCACLC